MHLSFILLTFTVIVSIIVETTSFDTSSWKTCPGLHIRNDLKSFEALRSCNIIVGPLTIALVQNHTHPFQPEDYDKLSFPELREITDYLLFFRVQGLTSLSKLFPNLSVIRGRVLVADYALIIYEMTQLQTIDLPNLGDILRGSIRIESNPNLCYASTVNWAAICKKPLTAHFLRKNNERCNNRCPDHCQPWISNGTDPENNHKIQGDVEEFGSSNNKSIFCWNSKDCHQMCGGRDNYGVALSLNGTGCCSNQCAGGCYLPANPAECFSCRHLIQESRCVSQCDTLLFEYRDECITQDACIAKTEKGGFQHSGTYLNNNCLSGNSSSTIPTSHLKAIRHPGESFGRCQATCLKDHEEDPLNKHHCKPCDRGKCRKVCTPDEDRMSGKRIYTITTVNSLRLITGCNVINGSLELSNLKGGKNVLNELTSAFRELEEIYGFLKITRSQPITTLGFLDNLKVINGTDLDRKDYSLLVIDNPNLQQLFMFEKSDINDQKQLKILQGKIFFHLNPKLCLFRINNLKTYAQVEDWDDGDVSPLTNGDREACSTENLWVRYIQSNPKMAQIRFENFAVKMPDPRSLLYYLINYREVASGTVTMFDGRDGCNSQNDAWFTEEVSPATSTRNRSSSNDSDEYQDLVIHVKPATRYALYVKTFTISAKYTGAVSGMIYFETAPDTPEMPRLDETHVLTSSTVSVSWLPPLKPNGQIERYYIIVTKLEDRLDDIETTDICMITESRKTISNIAKEEPSSNKDLISSKPSHKSDDNSSCSRLNPEQKADLHAEVITFQDQMIEIVYIKPNCAASISSSPSNIQKNGKNHKRSIYQQEQLNASDNSIKFKLGEPRNHPDFYKPIKNADIDTNLPTTYDASSSSSNSPAPTQNPLPQIEFNNSIKRAEANITVDKGSTSSKFSAVITNLEHFSQYQISITACHGKYENPLGRTSSSYKPCGMEVQTYIRTLQIPENDQVQHRTIRYYPSNQTSHKNILVWNPPKNPNGQVLAYRVRFRQDTGDTNHWTYLCISNSTFHKHGFVFPSLASGTYLVDIQSITLYSIGQGDPVWSSPSFEFVIVNNDIDWIIVGSIVVIVIAAMAASIATAIYYKKKNAGLVYASVNPDYIEYIPDEWEVDIEKLQIGKKIGKGSFGYVYRAFYTHEKGYIIECAVKTVGLNSTAKQRVDFLREATLMKSMDTFHIIKLFGVVSTNTPVFVVMELMGFGDLKNYLRERRAKDHEAKKTHVDNIYLMAAQIADGMCYLAARSFVHRDLAARNCMVNADKIVKIGDFGMSRDVFGHDYYRRDTSGALPVRWMSPESLRDNVYTVQSDTWSYGVVLWEISTWCEHPFSGLANDQVVKLVMRGNFRLSRPLQCPDQIWSIMESCWNENPGDRPDFMDIVRKLIPLMEGKLNPASFYFNQKEQMRRFNEGNKIVSPFTTDPTTIPLIKQHIIPKISAQDLADIRASKENNHLLMYQQQQHQQQQQLKEQQHQQLLPLQLQLPQLQEE